MGGATRAVPVGIDLTAAGTTVDAYVSILDWKVQGLGKKHIWLKNTSVANGFKYKVLTYVSGAASGALEKEFVSETTLAAAGTDEFVLERAYSRIVIQVKAAVGSSQATYQIDYTGGQT